jgi:DNA-binding transcriptional LysR family regulator
MPWEFRVGEDIVSRAIPAAFCSNDIEIEARAVVAGQAIGQLLGPTAAPLVRAGKLRLLLTRHVAEHLGLYVYYGSRTAQPARVRAFIDLAVEMVAGNTAFFLEPHELVGAAAKTRKPKQPKPRA